MVQFSAILPSFLGHTLSCGPLGRLRLFELLGTGAYGTVWLARDLASPDSNPVRYAVKCLLRHPKDSEQDQLQKREIAFHKTASQHPHVVKLHSVVEEEHFVFLIMDYCPGGDLFSAIIDRRSFMHNDARVKMLFVQLLDAVHACHDKNIFHRDLKPENIMCSKDDNHIYLADFGLATKSKLSANFGGSSFYMSPECVGIYPKRKPYSAARSDIWSLGVILVNIVTGRSPWHIASPRDDPGFRTYLRDGTAYLRRTLPISRAASELFGAVFELDPSKRMTLKQLRAAVLALPSFTTDIPDYIRIADASHRRALRQSEAQKSTETVSAAPLSAAGPSKVVEPGGSGKSAAANASMFVNGSRVPVQGASVSFPGLCPDLSSATDGSVLATPETNACDLTGPVPDMVLDPAEGSGNEFRLDAMDAKGPEVSQKKMPRTIQKMVSAVNRIRVRA